MTYQLPSRVNPRTEGGVLSNAISYGKVLSVLTVGELPSENSMSDLSRDRTPIGTNFEFIPNEAREYGE